MEAVKQTFTQVKVLTWKNATLRRRNWSILLFEIIIPVAVLLGLWSIKQVQSPKFVGPSIPTKANEVESLSSMYSDESFRNNCNIETLVFR